MKVLITGGAGFLGLHLAWYLHRRGWTVSLLDVAPFDRKEYPPAVGCIAVDVRNRKRLAEIFRDGRFRAVVHAAAALPLWRRQDIFSTNVGGTRNVLDLAVENSVERMVFISSTAVYGVPTKHPIAENDPLRGVGPYGESKILAERVSEAYRERGLVVPVLRPKTFIGPGRLGVFEILFDWIRAGKRIPLIGSGANRYQLLDVEDLAEAISRCLVGEPKLVNQTFNVGAREFGTVAADVGALLAFAKNGSRVLPLPAGVAKGGLRLLERFRLSPLYAWVYETADRDSFVSTDRAERSLNWQPRYSNAQALVRAYRWYLEHLEEVAGAGSGLTHRKPWAQGILRLIRAFM